MILRADFQVWGNWSCGWTYSESSKLANRMQDIPLGMSRGLWAPQKERQHTPSEMPHTNRWTRTRTQLSLPTLTTWHVRAACVFMCVEHSVCSCGVHVCAHTSNMLRMCTKLIPAQQLSRSVFNGSLEKPRINFWLLFLNSITDYCFSILNHLKWG